jgi:predicted GNAT family N-acyltransferase
MPIVYRINADVDPRDVQRLRKQTDWASDRSLDGITAMLSHTFIHVTAWDDEKLVGFVRAITDTVYRAVIDDVVVHADHRGQRVGTQLMESIGVELSGVEEVILGCSPSVVPFYETLGYVQYSGTHMRRP